MSETVRKPADQGLIEYNDGRIGIVDTATNLTLVAKDGLH